MSDHSLKVPGRWMFVCLFVFSFSTGFKVLEQKRAVSSVLEQLQYENQVFLEILARDLCGCYMIIRDGAGRAGKCSPMLEQFTIWPSPLQDSRFIIPCQNAFFPTLLPLREFLFSKSERIWFKFGNNWGKTEYDGRISLSCSFLTEITSFSF